MDGTGPQGKGPRTGRGQGRCKKNTEEKMIPGQGRGQGKGQGRGQGKGQGRSPEKSQGRGQGAGSGRRNQSGGSQ